MYGMRSGSWMPFGGHDTPGWPGSAERLRMVAEHGGGRGKRGGRGFGGPPPGFGGPGHGGPFGFAPGPKARRGDVRASVLTLLAEEPRNGYQIIQEIDQRSGGVWRPSAGSVYPALQQLQDEGLVREAESGARRLFELTDEGREHVDNNMDSDAAPWDTMSESVGEQEKELRHVVKEMMMAVAQVGRAGSAKQVAEAHRIVTDARKSLYRLLAEDDEDADDAD